MASDEERAKQQKILDKRTTDNLKETWERQDREEQALEEAAMAPPVITEKRCGVCMSPYRAWIEQQLVKGAANYSQLAKAIPPDENGKKINRNSFKNHMENHMPIGSMEIRAQLEEEADFLRQNYETGVKSALTEKGALKTLVKKAYEDAVSGVQTVQIKDMIAAIKLLKDLEETSSIKRAEEAELQFNIFAMAIKNACSDEQLMKIAAEVQRIRNQENIGYNMETVLEPPKIELVDAEIVDE